MAAILVTAFSNYSISTGMYVNGMLLRLLCVPTTLSIQGQLVLTEPAVTAMHV